MSSAEESFCVLMLVAACSFCGCAFGCQSGREEVRRDAIRAGVAERVVADQVGGDVEFRWRECYCDACVYRRQTLALQEADE